MAELSGSFSNNDVDELCVFNALDSVVVIGKEEGIGMRPDLLLAFEVKAASFRQARQEHGRCSGRETRRRGYSPKDGEK